MADSDKTDEDFAAMLAEYERTSPTPSRRDRLQVGDLIQGQVVSIGRDAVFVEVGAKAEATLDLDQVRNPDGTLAVAVGDRIEARVAEVRGGAPVLRMSIGRGPDAGDELGQAFEHQIPVEGLITAVNKGGVEVQVAGLRAFCPVSQLDNRFVQDPNDFVGKRFTFRITKFEGGKRPNIVLSRRVLLEEEAAVRAAETRATLREGAVVKGTVISVKSYGAFVDIGGLEGLLHVSELGFARVDHPADVLHEGQTLEVQVVKIEKTGDPKRPEKIGLSLKALERDPWDEAAARLVEGARIRGVVTRLQQFGAFVEIAPGVEGLVHISELGADQRINHPREVVTAGQEVEVTVLGVDREKRRVSLSIGAVRASEEAAQVAAYAPPTTTKLGTFADLLQNAGRGDKTDRKGSGRKR